MNDGGLGSQIRCQPILDHNIMLTLASYKIRTSNKSWLQIKTPLFTFLVVGEPHLPAQIPTTRRMSRIMYLGMM